MKANHNCIFVKVIINDFEYLGVNEAHICPICGKLDPVEHQTSKGFDKYVYALYTSKSLREQAKNYGLKVSGNKREVGKRVWEYCRDKAMGIQ
tara:strand:- start:401 stop:679 length:279 start_codon:yes stop_codon:yes gene_type:complete